MSKLASVGKSRRQRKVAEVDMMTGRDLNASEV